VIHIVPHPPAGAPLVDDYLRGRGEAPRFYDGSPGRLDAYRIRLRDVGERFGPAERAAAAATLRPTSERARQRLEAFAARGGAMVTTGQQAGLFGGPLYTLYKALTAIKLAEALETELGILVLPVFWVASEDHDWAEVNHTWVVDERDRLLRISIQGVNAPLLPVSARRIVEVAGALDALGQAFAPTEHINEQLKRFLGVYRAGEPVAAAFSHLLEEVLRGFDLCLVDAASPQLKRASRPFLAEEVRAPEVSERLLAERTAELLSAGYHEQVAVQSGATQLFIHTERGRERLLHDGLARIARESGSRWDVSQLLDRLEREPESLSPNALMRPVVEAGVFPTIAYVGGPAELAYLAQAQPLFGRFGIRAPVAVPRFSATLVEPRIARYLQRLGLDTDQLSTPRHTLLARIVREHLPSGLDTSLAALRRELVEGFSRVADHAGAIDPTLDGVVGSARNRALRQVAQMERRIEREFRRGHGELERRLDAVLNHLHPRGQPQERVLNALPFVAAGGERLLHEIHAAIRPPWEDGA
jgi:bacillithiol synthase